MISITAQAMYSRRSSSSKCFVVSSVFYNPSLRVKNTTQNHGCSKVPGDREEDSPGDEATDDDGEEHASGKEKKKARQRRGR
jgi:hypothetical protein